MDYEMLVMLITGEHIPERVEEAIAKGYLYNVLGTLVIPQNTWYDIHKAREDLLAKLLADNETILNLSGQWLSSIDARTLQDNTRKILNLRKIKPMETV